MRQRIEKFTKDLYREIEISSQRIEKEFSEFKKLAGEDRPVFVNLISQKPKGVKNIKKSSLTFLRGTISFAENLGR